MVWNSLWTHRAGSPVVPLGLVEVDGEIIQGPGEGEVHGGVVGRVALQGDVLAHVDVGARWCQRDLGGICRKRAGRAVSSQCPHPSIQTISSSSSSCSNSWSFTGGRGGSRKWKRFAPGLFVTGSGRSFAPPPEITLIILVFGSVKRGETSHHSFLAVSCLIDPK